MYRGYLKRPALIIPKRYAYGAAAMAKEAHMGKKYTISNGEALPLRHFYLASTCGQDSVGCRLKRLETMNLGPSQHIPLV